MIELLWLLLPVAAASGWFVAKRSSRFTADSTSFKLSSDYLKGLSYLLNEQPDKAIDEFIKLIDVNSETVETHLALGVLFRRRGEVHRAIRIHQNLIARPSLSIHQRSLAVLELGQDYYRAGLLDRAENLFEQLITSDRYRVYAYRQLLDIYQQERDWDKAISTAQKLEKVSNESMQPVIAQYYCEQAESAQQQNRYDVVLQKVREALKADARCVRASLLEGHLALAQGDNVMATHAFKRVEQQDPSYLVEIIEPLQTCYAILNQPNEFMTYLSHIVEKYNDTMPLLKLANLVKEQAGSLQALELVVNRLTKQPSLCGLDYVLDLALTEQQLSRKHLLLLKEMTTQLLQSKPLYQCHQCGFAGKNLHWQCPSCKQWNTTKFLQESYE